MMVADRSRQPRSTPPTRLVSLAQPAPALSLKAFLHAAAGHERFYWREPDGHAALAGFGAATELKAWGEKRFQSIEKAARALFAGAICAPDAPEWAGPRLFGGFAFRDDFVPDHTWAVFHPAHFVLPHFQLAQSEAETWLTINALLPEEEINPQGLETLRQALALRYAWLCQRGSQAVGGLAPAATGAPAAGVEVNYPLSYAGWEAMIEAATGQMAQGRLKKVVLSRVCEIRAQQALDIDQALAILGQKYPDCYQFLFEPQPGQAFLGATPELLARQRGLRFESMALAGSIRRGRSAAEDELLADELLESAKDRFEHDLVVQELRRRVSRFAAPVSIPQQPDILRLHNIQHLHTPVSGQLKKPASILALVSALHPTPAMGGLPRPAALAFIRETEEVTRGWYAAPVGWLDQRLEGTFAVAIRSAVTQLERAWLYAGAGIVADSQPGKEWEETALKFRPILQALQLEPEILEAR